MNIKEGEELQVKGIGNMVNKIIEHFPNLQKEMPIQVEKASRTPNRHEQNKMSPLNIIVQTIITKNKEWILKAVKEKVQ
jgi:hypothetical protein